MTWRMMLALGVVALFIVFMVILAIAGGISLCNETLRKRR